MYSLWRELEDDTGHMEPTLMDDSNNTSLDARGECTSNEFYTEGIF